MMSVSTIAVRPGGAWRDFDSDGFPDIFFPHHFTYPPGNRFSDASAFPASLLVNARGERFSDQGRELFGRHPGDWHGGTWVDFDADGDSDLFVSRGGNSGAKADKPLTVQQKALTGNLFFVQAHATFRERAEHLGLSFYGQRGRRSSWFDMNGDGLLDVFLGQTEPEKGQNVLLLQSEQAFRPCGDFPGLGSRDALHTVFAFPGFDDDARYVQMGLGSGRLFRQSSDNPCRFDPISHDPALPRRWAVETLFADLDGDLALESISLWLDPPVGLDARRGYMRLELPGKSELSRFEIRSLGPVQLSIRPPQGPKGWANPGGSRVFLGAKAQPATAYQISLDAGSELFRGKTDASHDPIGVFVHYNDKAETWVFGVNKDGPQGVTLDLRGEHPLEVVIDPKIVDAPASSGGVMAFVQGRRGWANGDQALGLSGIANRCSSASAKDLDNDGDLDIALLCDSPGNVDAISALVNEGGRFVQGEAIRASGGTTGAGDSISAGDFDVDGFVDLLATNGSSLANDAIDQGPVKLFRNNGNGNNWLRIRLLGADGGADPMGARVFLRSSEGTQMRYYDAGVRATAQDEAVLHFGLGKKPLEATILVQWPAGEFEEFGDIESNRELMVRQGEGRTHLAPMILASKLVAKVGETVGMLAIFPGARYSQPIHWEVDGSRDLQSTHRIRRVFDKSGIKRVRAYRGNVNGGQLLGEIDVVVK